MGPVWGEDGGEQEIVLVGQEAQKCEGVQLTFQNDGKVKGP